MAAQLLFLVKILTYFHGVPIRKIDCCPISLWHHKTQINLLCRLNQAILNGGRNAPFQLYVSNNMLIMSFYQGITFTVPFEHSHFIVKIAKFAMINEVKGIPVEMAQFRRACHMHALLKISTRQRGLIA